MLSGVAKDIITIGASMLVFGSIVGINQLVGFSLSLVGILLYKAYKNNLSIFLQLGFFGGLAALLEVSEKPQTPANIKDIELQAELKSEEDTACHPRVR
mmetsp:Transcript_127850/g.221623  ORF Transcript_127850/g.221623 Transcript_127850/m.221623 type:complete len:99 (+) Transcript_127850:527-823(+)